MVGGRRTIKIMFGSDTFSQTDGDFSVGGSHKPDSSGAFVCFPQASNKHVINPALTSDAYRVSAYRLGIQTGVKKNALFISSSTEQ